MNIHFIFIMIAIIVLLLVFFVVYCRIDERPKVLRKSPPIRETFEPIRQTYGEEEMNWQEKLADGLDPKLKKSNKDFIENVKRFGGSSVRNYEIEEMATNAAFTNWLGLGGRPKYVPIRASSREQPSFNTEVLKTVRRHLI